MLLDDTPVVPGDSHPAFEGAETARQILNDAEDELREWQPSHQEIPSNSGALGSNAMPDVHAGGLATQSAVPEGSVADTTASSIETGTYTDPQPAKVSQPTYAA